MKAILIWALYEGLQACRNDECSCVIIQLTSAWTGRIFHTAKKIEPEYGVQHFESDGKLYTGIPAPHIPKEKFLPLCKQLLDLKHQSILQFSGAYLSDNSWPPLLMMEKVDATLEALLQSKRGVDLFFRLHILADICIALDYLSKKNIVHGNLTSRRVFVDKNSMSGKLAYLGDQESGVEESVSDIASFGDLARTTLYHSSSTRTYSELLNTLVDKVMNAIKNISDEEMGYDFNNSLN